MTTYPVDLQVHSTRSDGTDAPAALVERQRNEAFTCWR